MKQAKVLSTDEVKRVLAVIAQDRHADRNRMAEKAGPLMKQCAACADTYTSGTAAESMTSSLPMSRVSIVRHRRENLKRRPIPRYCCRRIKHWCHAALIMK